MAIAASSVTPTNSLEDFRIEFNNLVSDVTGITSTNTFSETIVFEGATADAYETTLTVTDPTADRTVTLPNVTGTVTLDGNPLTSDGGTLGTTALEWSDIYLADGGVVYLGADQDVSLTHVADTGVLLNSTRKIQFGDSATFIHQSSDGVLTIDGEATIDLNASTAVLVSNDLKLNSDAAVLGFGVDNDVSLTHVADTGVLLNSTMKLQFNDASQFIHGSSATVLDIAATDEIELTATLIDAVGNFTVSGTIIGSDTIQGTTITATTAFVPDASDGAALGTTALEFSDLFLADGAVINFGDDQDITLTHNADTGLTLNGVMVATTVEPSGDTATGDNAALGYTSVLGAILTGQGSTNDVTLVNDADATVLSIPTGTTNVTIAGDLTISGDDLFMGTNTDAYILVADGTNYNPVAVSGDVTISNSGAVTIAATSVEGSMLNNNVISGLTALTSGLATTDEVMVSDAGTLKRMDVSLIVALSAGDATALAIALG